MYGDGSLKRSTRRDTSHIDNKIFIRNCDTIFYSGGQPYSVDIRMAKSTDNDGYTFESLGTKYYKRDGTLIDSSTPDSLYLMTFKDNVDCYYGLKNKRGDTIFKPRFDRIEIEQSGGFIKTYLGDVCTLYRLDGSPMKQSSAHLARIYTMTVAENTRPVSSDSKDYVDYVANKTRKKYFGFLENDHKEGVMTQEGEIVMPPQHFSLGRTILGDGRFFSFYERQGDSTIKQGFLDRRGKPLFSPRFDIVSYTGCSDYFLLDTKKSSLPPNEWLMGLGKGDNETVVLEPKFVVISYLTNGSLFIVKTPELKKTEEKDRHKYNGIYNPHAQKWLLPTNTSVIEEQPNDHFSFFILKNLKTTKYSIMDTTGKFIVSESLSLDSIGIITNVDNLFWVKKKNKYHLLDIKNGQAILHPTGYDYLDMVYFSESIFYEQEYYPHFLAKNKGKWGFIDAQEHIVKPFEYDYASKMYDETSDNWGIFLVKNNKASYFTLSSLPNEIPEFPTTKNASDTRKALYSFPLADNSDCLFFINDTGKVMIPPQYKKSENTEIANCQIVEDAQKHKKIIFQESNQVVDFPFKSEIKWANAKSQIMIVKDTTMLSLGVVSVTGRQLIPCVNYGVAIGDLQQSVFFVKRDTPLIKRYFNDYDFGFEIINLDSLNAEDLGWLMYDANGKLLDNNPFRFPIDFTEGIGIGMQGEDFNLYKTDGSILLPFDKKENRTVEKSFNNIRRLEPNNFYACYRNQGLTPTMLVTKSDGQILVESGRYDGISTFLGQYALVSAAGRIGLIDTFGHEIIAPQDLLSYQGTFMDSINKTKQFLHYEKDEEPTEPISQNPPFSFQTKYSLTTDSLKVSAVQRTALLNLMLQKSLPWLINKANNLKIPRVSIKENEFFISGVSYPVFAIYLNHLTISDATISFAWIPDYNSATLKFFNFQKVKDTWVEKNLYDILDIQSNKRLVLNDLLTQKIKALKDVSIDCSNSSAFLNQVEHRFMLTEKGIDFCFASEKSWGSDTELVIIPFTWQELAPFLKK